MPNPFPGMNPYLQQPEFWSDFRKHAGKSLVEVFGARVAGNPLDGGAEPLYSGAIGTFASSIRVSSLSERHQFLIYVVGWASCLLYYYSVRVTPAPQEYICIIGMLPLGVAIADKMPTITTTNKSSKRVNPASN